MDDKIKNRGRRSGTSVSKMKRTNRVQDDTSWDMDGVCLSAESKAFMLKLKKVKDPFDPEHQEVFTDLLRFVETKETKDVNLSEAGLLLQGATKLYNQQVLNIRDNVDDLVIYVTNAPPKVRGRKKTIPEDGQEGTQANSVDPGVSDPQKLNSEANNTDAGQGAQGDNVSQETVLTESSTETVDGVPSTETVDGVPSTETVDGVPTTETPDGVPTTVSDDAASRSASDSGFGSGPSSTADGGVSPVTVGLPDSADAVADVTCDTFNETMGPPVILTATQQTKAREKKIYPDPPLLISCFQEEWLWKEQRQRISKYPPVLTPELPLRKRKQGNEDPNKEKRAKKDKVVVVGETTDGTVQMSEDAIISDLNDSSVPEEIETTPVDDAERILKTHEVVPDIPRLASADSATTDLCEFSSEDQAVVADCITKLHYLSFTFELSKSEISKVFDLTMAKYCGILSKYNVPISRSMLPGQLRANATPQKDSSSGTCVTAEPGPSTSGGFPTIQNIRQSLDFESQSILEQVNSRNEASFFDQVNGANMMNTTSEESVTPESSTFMESIKNGKKIYELTEERTSLDSRAKLKAMLNEMRTSLVLKYSKVPLIAEHSPEFQKRITDFEKKMKRILAQESQKEEFDVRKYEMDVLEAANEDDDCQVQPSSNIESVVPSPLEEGGLEDLDTMVFQGSYACPTSPSVSEFGAEKKWVPIQKIFDQMKILSREEACRVFYALLGLLSFENLDFNYDNLYSPESAKIIKKGLDPLQDELFPTGKKILTSRCPDIDKDDVFVAALTSKSRTVAFREQLARESQNLGLSDDKTNSIVSGITDVLGGSQFVQEASPSFSGHLFSKRQRKTNTLKVPSSQAMLKQPNPSGSNTNN